MCCEIVCCAGSLARACRAGQRCRELLSAQVFVLDRLLEEDGVTGDQYGPYDPEFVVSERERLRRDKVRSSGGSRLGGSRCRGIMPFLRRPRRTFSCGRYRFLASRACIPYTNALWAERAWHAVLCLS